MVWVIAFGELFFGDLWCVVWGYGGMRTHFSLLNPQRRQDVCSLESIKVSMGTSCGNGGNNVPLPWYMFNIRCV